jgi:hypothetical protein
MGGSPNDTGWPGPISPIFDVNAYFTADQIAQNRDSYLSALNAVPADGAGISLSTVARSLGIEAPEVLYAYLDGWPEETARTLVTAVRNAVYEGRPLIFGWKDTPAPITVVAPDAWSGDQPIPVIVCGPHP